MQLTNSSNADDADDGSSVLAIGGNATTRSSRRSFDDLTSATVSSLQLITGAGWTSLVHHALHSSPTLAIIIPFAVLFGKYWLLQLLTGVFIARLPEQPILRRSEAHRSGLRSGRQAVREALREEHEQLAGAAPGRRVRCQSAPAEAPTAMSKEGGVPAGSDARVSPETDTAATVRRGAGPQHWARSIVSWQWSRAPSVSFDGLVLTCIMASLVCLTLETALDASAEAVLLGADIALTSIFTLELLLQIASAGGIRRWTAVGWNVLDGIIVASALLSLALRYIVGVEGDEAAAMKSFRTLRVLRPLRLIKSSPRLQSTVDTILTTLPHTLAILLMAIFSWFLLAVVGNLLFGHVQLRECHGASAALSPSACLAVGGELIPAAFNMESTVDALLTLFSLFKLDDWSDLVWGILEQLTTSDGEPHVMLRAGLIAYMIAFILFGVLVPTSFFLAVVVNQYADIRYEVLLESQRQWLATQRVRMRRRMLSNDRSKWFARAKVAPGNSLGHAQMAAPRQSSWTVAYERRALRPTARYLEYRRDLVVRLNGLSPSDEEVAVPETWLAVRDACWKLVCGQPPHQYLETGMCILLALNLLLSLVLAEHSSTRQTIVYVALLAVCTLEVILKVLAYGLKGYASYPADACDFAVVVLMLVLVPFSLTGRRGGWLVVPLSAGGDHLDVFLARFGGLVLFYRVPRLLQHWRFLRDALRPTRALLDTLVFALPSLLNVVALTLMLLYIYAVLGFFWFGDIGLSGITPAGTNITVDYWLGRAVSTGINDRANFHTLPRGMLTLVRILTGDQWGELLGDCMRGVDGQLTAVRMVFAVIFYASFLFVASLCVNLLVAVLLTQGIETYFDTGLLKSSTLPFVLLKCKRKFMRPVYHLRRSRELGSRQRVLMHQERAMQARLVEYWLSRLDFMLPSMRSVRVPDGHWLKQLPRTYYWLQCIPPTYYLWQSPLATGQEPPEEVVGALPDEHDAKGRPKVSRLEVVRYDCVAQVYWRFKVRRRLRTLDAREVEQLFLVSCWDAALHADVPAMLDLNGEEQAGRRVEKEKILERQQALARIHALLFFRPGLARSSRVKWTLTGDSPLHAAAFMGDVGLALLLMKCGASPRRTNSDGLLTIGPEVREVATVLVPGVTPEMTREVCSRMIAEGLAEERGHILPEAYADALGFLSQELRDKMSTSQASAIRRFGKKAWLKPSGSKAGGVLPGFGQPAASSLSGLKQMARSRALAQMRDITPPMDMKQLASLRECVMHRNTCVHYAILGFQPACLRGLENEERPAISLANHLRMQASVLELLLWPQAFTEANDPHVKLLAGDPAKPNINGDTPLDLAAKQGSDELLQKLLAWDNDQQELQSDQADSASSESLSNMHNETSGDTPLLACLRDCGRRLRWVGDQGANKYNEYHLLELLAASGALLRHQFTDPFVRGRACLSPTYGLPMPGGGASPLLFLLMAANRTEAALSVESIASDRQVMLTEALDLITTQLEELVDRAEIDALQEELFRMHEPNVYRVFGGAAGKVCVVDLMLRSRRKTLVTHKQVRAAVLAAWSSSSRYYFSIALFFFLVCLLCVSCAGWFVAADLYALRASIEFAARLPLATQSGTSTWFHWVSSSLVSAVIPPVALVDVSSGGNSTCGGTVPLVSLSTLAPEETAWFAVDGLVLTRTKRAWSDSCAYPRFDGVADVCELLPPSNVSSNATDMVYVSLEQGLCEAQAQLTALASQWTDVSTESISLSTHLLSMRDSVLCRFDAELRIDWAGQPIASHTLEMLKLQPSILEIAVTSFAYTYLCFGCIHQTVAVYLDGWLHFSGFDGPWNFLVLLSHVVAIPTAVVYIVQNIYLASPPLSDPASFSLAQYSGEAVNVVLRFSVLHRQLLSFLILLMWIRLLRFMRAFHSFGIVVRAMVVMGNDLFGTVLGITFLLWVGFSFAFFTIYGDRQENLSTLVDAYTSVWRMATGDASTYGMLVSVDQATRTIGMFYYYAVTILLTFFVINLIIGIMAESYIKIASEQQLQYMMLHASLTLNFYVRLDSASGEEFAGGGQQAARRVHLKHGAIAAQARNRSGRIQPAESSTAGAPLSPSHPGLTHQRTSATLRRQSTSASMLNPAAAAPSPSRPGLKRGSTTRWDPAAMQDEGSDGAGFLISSAARMAEQLSLNGCFMRWQRLCARSEWRPTTHLQTYLNDERKGFDLLQRKFLHQMADPCFGSALEKLRYLRQVFKQHGADEVHSTTWLLSFGTRMLTPTSERSMLRLQLRFPHVPERNLLAMLRVFESPSTASAVLTGEHSPTREDEFRVTHALAQVANALDQFKGGFRDELPRDEMLRVEFWKSTSASFTQRKLKRRNTNRLNGTSYRQQVFLNSPRSGEPAAARSVLGSINAITSSIPIEDLGGTSQLSEQSVKSAPSASPSASRSASPSFRRVQFSGSRAEAPSGEPTMTGVQAVTSQELAQTAGMNR